MNSFKQSILGISSNKIALVSKDMKVSFGQLFEFIEQNRQIVESIRNSNVVVHARSRFEFAKLLVLLDGEVNNILFIPQDIHSKLFNKYYKDAEIEHEVYLDGNNLKINTINENVKTDRRIKETSWIIPTSGTTDIPKLISHTFRSLTRTVKTDTDTGKDYIWGLVFDIYRFSGIQVFLQSLIGGSTLIISETNDSMSDILNNLIKNNCNALSATPSFWRKVMMSKEVNNLDFKVVTLGGEIADENILQVLKSKFPSAKISHIYASTEAGVGFSVTDTRAGFPKKYIDNGINGITLKLSDRNTLLINNGNQDQKYLSTNRLYKSDGFIDTGDIIEVKGDRAYFLGRDSGAINVGGNKVQPEEVETVLLGSGLVHAAYVYAKKNSIIGNIVCADLVLIDPNADIKEIKKEILKFSREKLENFKVPAIIKFVTELQTTHSGKLKRD